MSSEETSTQARVGIFLLIGLVTVALMVVYFGRLGEGFNDYYDLRVEFSNASGILRGSEVLLAGAKIGRVTEPPAILPDMRGVSVPLRVLEQVELPVDSQISVGSSGLLGDKFIQITIPDDASTTDFIQPGQTVRGSDDTGMFGGMADGANELIAELRATVKNIDAAVSRINKGVLGKEELESISSTIRNLDAAVTRVNTKVLGDKEVEQLNETVANIRETSAKLAEASAKADNLIAKADQAVLSGKEAMDSAREAAEELDRTLASARSLIHRIRSGDGVLANLINNRGMAENLSALLSNLRRHGILWYRDTAQPRQEAGDTTTAE